jgi:carbamoyltransferase
MMKIDDIIKKSSEYFPVENLKSSDLKPVFNFLTDAGYTERNVIEKLRIDDLDAITIKNIDYYLKVRLKENNKLDVVIQLFLLCCSITLDKAIETFGESLLDLMIKAKLLEKKDSVICSPVDVFPIRGFYIATDHAFSRLSVRKKVYPLMGDSLCLARGILEENVESSLDLCTGSGVQAIVASEYSQKVIGVDINPRALNFARFNALLNQVENVEFREGNLYEAVKNEKFDRITANPPFVPSPESKLYYRDGAETGEVILEKIISGLPQYLKESGVCQIVTLLVFTGSDYNSKIRRWLNYGLFHLLTLYGTFMSVESYINLHLNYCAATPSYYTKKMKSWLDSYNAAGIKMLSQGLLNIKRSSHNTPFSEMKLFRSTASESCMEEVKTWFDAVESMKDPDYIESLVDKVFMVSPKVDFLLKMKSTGNNKDNKYELFFRETSPYMSMQLSEESKIILEKIMYNRNNEPKTVSNMLSEEVKSDFLHIVFPSLILLNLIKDSVITVKD